MRQSNKPQIADEGERMIHMKIYYEDVLVGEVVTNKSMTVGEALELVSFDEEAFLAEQGFDSIDYNDFRLDYSGN